MKVLTEIGDEQVIVAFEEYKTLLEVRKKRIDKQIETLVDSSYQDGVFNVCIFYSSFKALSALIDARRRILADISAAAKGV